MTKKRTDGLTAQEAKDLESLGYVEGNPNTIPDNISPVLKSKILEAYAEENDLQTAQDYPDATSRQNQMVRERAAADGDEDMQKYTGVQGGESTGGRQTDAASGQTARSGDKK